MYIITSQLSEVVEIVRPIAAILKFACNPNSSSQINLHESPSGFPILGKLGGLSSGGGVHHIHHHDGVHVHSHGRRRIHHNSVLVSVSRLRIGLTID